MKYLKIFSLVGLGFLVLIQFYRPARNIDEGQVTSLHMTEVIDVPVNVRQILQTACNDCHSNNTEYPWYSYIQPVRFFIEDDIQKGKENLNFSEFGNYSERQQENKLDRIAKQIKSDEMPLKSYTFMHRDAKLSDNQKQEIIDWINIQSNQKE